MKHAILTMALSTLALTGCGFTTSGDVIRTTISKKGAEVMDQGLVNAEWFMCNAASVGAVQRRYGGSPELADAYETLCRHGNPLPVRLTPAPDPDITDPGITDPTRPSTDPPPSTVP